MNIKEIKAWLEHSPQAKPGNPELGGFKLEKGIILCNECSGRLIGRGILLRNSMPIWTTEKSKDNCHICFKPLDPTRAQTHYELQTRQEYERRHPKNIKGLTIDPNTDPELVECGIGVKFPEFGPNRLYADRNVSQGIILPIAGRNWKVRYHFPNSDTKSSEPGILEFDLTEESETPFETTPENDKTYDTTAFGQPKFIQNAIMPNFNGEAPKHLFTLETGWGDCGNINILLNLDEQGHPAVAWFEASCA